MFLIRDVAHAERQSQPSVPQLGSTSQFLEAQIDHIAECVIEVVRNLEFFVLGRLLWLLDFFLNFISMIIGLEVGLSERLDLQRSGRSILDDLFDQLRDCVEQMTQGKLLVVGDLRLEEDSVTLATVFCDDSLDSRTADGSRDVLMSSNYDYIGVLRVHVAPVF